MTIIWLIILVIIVVLLRCWHADKDVSFWQDLFRVVTLRVVDYFCKGTPTKVIMLYLKTSCILYGGISFTYPIIRAGLECDKQNSFGKLFLEFQWDSFGSTASYIFLICNSIVVTFYFYRYRSDDIIGIIKNILHHTNNIEKQNNLLLSNEKTMDKKLDLILSQLGNSESSIKHLLPLLKESIGTLKVETASKYLNTIWDETLLRCKNDYSLQSTIQYLQGECARFTKGGNSKWYHDSAYQLMKKSGESDEQILAGVIYETCRSHDYVNADLYSKELKNIAPHNCWGYVSELMQADNLSAAVNELPSCIDIEETLAICIMLGGGRSDDLGIDITCYRYHSLNSITIENFALWIMDLSVATTHFCQSFMIHKNINDMNTPQCRELFMLLDKFLNELGKTEIENPLPDTVFLHAATGYFGNHEKSWLVAFKDFKPSKGMEEICYLTYAVLLSDSGQYDQAKALLMSYIGDSLASILNMRFVLAIWHNDLSECIEIFKCACEKKVIIPDHLAHYFFATVHNFYDSIKEHINNICFESDIVKIAFRLFLDFKSGNRMNIEPIIQNKTEFPYSVAPYMAIVAKENGNLPTAIEILELAADYKVLDIRTSLLIEYYQDDKSYSQKLYHLLIELRKAGQMDLKTLSLELNISNQVGDNENCLSITSELVKLVPNDVNAWVNHVQSLYRCDGYSNDIVELKARFVNADLSVQATMVLFNIYHAINETLFALDILYDQIVRTQDQNLKDFLFSMHLNPGVDKYISVEKDIVDCGDFVTLFYEGKTKEYVVSKGSVYEELVGCKVGDKKEIVIKEPVVVEIRVIRTKYYKLLCDIIKDIGDNQGSRNVKMFSVEDFDFANDPIGALRKMAGKTDEVVAREKALRTQYQNGELSLFNFIDDCSGISDTYEKLFGRSFMVCSLPVKFFEHVFGDSEEWKHRKIALDITSLVSLYEFDRRYGLKYSERFFLPKSVTLLIKEQLVNEEKGMPKFTSQYVADKIGYDVIDNTKTILWNKLRSLEEWINNHCIVETVEEIINLDFSKNDSQLWKVEMESLLLTQKGMLLLTEDWCFQKHFLNLFPALSIFQWLSLMGMKNADAWGDFMLECGNVGYPIKSEYIRSQYDLMSNNHQNNYQTCLENVKYNPESIEMGVEAAKSLIEGIIEPAKIVGATNLLSVMFSSVSTKICELIIQREFVKSKNELWNQCLVDALRISHPLIILE